MNYNWNWAILITDPYFDWIVSGLGWTLAVAICAWIIAFPLGTIVGIMRTSQFSAPLAHLMLKFFATSH